MTVAVENGIRPAFCGKTAASGQLRRGKRVVFMTAMKSDKDQIALFFQVVDALLQSVKIQSGTSGGAIFCNAEFMLCLIDNGDLQTFAVYEQRSIGGFAVHSCSDGFYSGFAAILQRIG